MAVAVAATVSLVAASCASDGSASVPSTTGPTTTTAPAGPTPSPTTLSLPPVSGPHATGRTPLPGFGEVAVRIVVADGEARLFCVLAARTVAQRQRGLMTVTDETLGGYDGMLFEFGGEVSGGFWMRNTPMPLSIVYLDAGGSPVETFEMEPCADSPDCPSYRPDAPYHRALEVPQGALTAMGMGPGARLQQAGACRPA
ncbi:MAG: DUF192 domain-containing protein [Acidimicrobiales bacterium]